VARTGWARKLNVFLGMVWRREKTERDWEVPGLGDVASFGGLGGGRRRVKHRC